MTKTSKAITARELIKILRQDHGALDLPVYIQVEGLRFAPITKADLNKGPKFFVQGCGSRHHTKGFLLK